MEVSFQKAILKASRALNDAISTSVSSKIIASTTHQSCGIKNDKSIPFKSSDKLWLENHNQLKGF